MSSDAYRLLAAHLRSLASNPSALLDPGVPDKLRSDLVETQPWGERAAGDQPAAPETTASTTGRPVRSRSRPSPLAGTTGGRLESVRANLVRTSEVFRHAVRVGATLAVAVAISHLFPLGHGYWLAMTVMIVLKPDFAATLSRGLGRSPAPSWVPGWSRCCWPRWRRRRPA